jgi:hypothetical protein
MKIYKELIIIFSIMIVSTIVIFLLIIANVEPNATERTGTMMDMEHIVLYM